MSPGALRVESAGRSAGWLLVAAFAAVALLFALAFGDHGYFPTDQGFILAQSWRVQGGQVPYRDFFYIRPPGSLYLHTIWFALPELWIFRAGRFAYYAQIGLAGLVPALFALRAGLVSSPLRLVFSGVAFYAIALHNFPPMPWYTVDGVFFSSLALAALLSSQRAEGIPARLGWRVLASFLGVLASLMKQNFAALPAALILADVGVAILAFSRRDERDRVRRLALCALASALPALGVLGLVAVGLAASDAWAPFTRQVGGASSLEGLLRSGLLPWAEPSIVVAAAIGFALVVATLQSKAAAGRKRLVTAAVLLLVPVLLAWTAWNLGSSVLTQNESGHWLFAAIAGGSLASILDGFRRSSMRSEAGEGLRAVLQLGVLGTAWCASVSIGAPTPLLGLAAGGIAVETLLPPIRRHVRIHLLLWGLCAAVTVASVFELNLEHPYRTVPREQQKSALHEVFPRFGKLYAGQGVAGRMADLRRQVETHALDPGRDFTVVPNFPLIHFLVERQTRAPMDWYVVFDLLALRLPVAPELLNFDGVILLVRPGSHEECTLEEFSKTYRGLSRRIFKHSRLLASSLNFCVVEPIAPDPEARSRQ